MSRNMSRRIATGFSLLAAATVLLPLSACKTPGDFLAKATLPAWALRQAAIAPGTCGEGTVWLNFPKPKGMGSEEEQLPVAVPICNENGVYVLGHKTQDIAGRTAPVPRADTYENKGQITSFLRKRDTTQVPPQADVRLLFDSNKDRVTNIHSYNDTTCMQLPPQSTNPRFVTSVPASIGTQEITLVVTGTWMKTNTEASEANDKDTTAGFMQTRSEQWRLKACPATGAFLKTLSGSAKPMRFQP
jgi:hypothetical protein